ncbi:hypothetical protein DV454_003534 [Geotrichum candidum]|nr:hypothetical protein DV454_003534 [Geotrichum candidum]
MSATATTSLDVSEIKSMMNDLEKSNGSTERIITLLTIFEEKVKPTEKLLRETKLGIAVNKFRSHGDKKVSELVKRIIKKWKDQVSAQKHKQVKHEKKPSTSTESNASTAKAGASSSSGSAAAGGKESGTPLFNSNGKARSPENDGVNTNVYPDAVRNSCISLLYKGLAVESTATPNDILTAAKSVEEAVFIGERGTGAGYKNKIRSLFANLKDPRNPQLRQRVVSGEIAGKRLYTMTPKELASDEFKKELEEINKQNLFNAQAAVEKRAITDRFTCSKCKQKKVSYFQMQTRSADEPLTTFCTCENCGKRWKFS